MTAVTSPGGVQDRFTVPLSRRWQLLRSGGLTPTAYREQLLEYVQDLDPVIRAFVDWHPAELTRSALPGAPSVTYKDTIDVAGFATRLGIRSGYRSYPRRSAEIARRLAQRGWVCLGKVTTTECALGSAKPSRNPVYPHVSPAGSSTGSAVAVAAGFCDVSVGSDSGGSLRWPAVYCGVTSLRLTPRDELLAGVHTVAASMESVGLVTRTAADLDWLWQRYRLSDLFGVAPRPAPARLRVAISLPPAEPVHPEIRALITHVGAVLARRGHAVEVVDLPDVWDLRAPAAALLAREGHESFQVLREDPGVELGADTLAALARGAAIDPAAMPDLRRAQADARTRLAALLRDDYDVLITPLEGELPDPADQKAGVSLPPADRGATGLAMTLVANIGALPVLALPLTLSSQGSPLGIQVHAAPDADETLVAVGTLLADLAR